MAYVEITRFQIMKFIASAISRGSVEGLDVENGFRVTMTGMTERSVRVDIANGDFFFIDIEHLVPPRPEPRIADAFYGAQCPSYPACSGGCGLGCTHNIEANRARNAEARR